MDTNTTPERVMLIADGDPDNSGIPFDSLDRAGFKVFVVQNSENVIIQAELNKPDLILLDILLPGIGGFEICRRLKENEKTQDISVMFMTALFETENTLKGFAMGAVDYITKPVQQEELLARVNAHLTIRRLQQQLHAKNALLERQVEQLQALNASKDKFISTISHDLQGPFSSLRGLIQFTTENLEGYNKSELEDIIVLLGNSTNNLYALIENLLTWSRIQRGALEHCPQRMDIRNLVTQTMNGFTENAENKQITLKNLIEEKTPVYADFNMVNTVLRNLISNALKFTNSGGEVEVSARQDGKDIEVSVKDNGIGIREEHLPKLFRIDTRYKRLGTAREKGTGLGLILCKEFIKKHGGRIWIESEVKRGSTVKFTLPQHPVE